jgi:hypothetical protein
MSSRELREWQAYETVFGPIGAERLDYLAAMLAERITNMLRMGGKTDPIKNFVPKWDRREIIEYGRSPESHDQARD